MKALLDDVRAFHVACDVPILDTPTVPAINRRDLRYYVATGTSEFPTPAVGNTTYPARCAP